MLLLLSGIAQAVDLVGAIGAEVCVNDPFVATAGIRAGGEVSLRPWLSFGLTGSHYPDLGESAQSSLTNQLISQHNVWPDISDLGWRAMAEARFTPLTVESGGWTRSLSGHVGIGAVHTTDDPGDSITEAFLLTEVQIHPMTLFGVAGEIYRERLGVRLRIERTAYSEDFTYDDTVSSESSRNHGWVGVEMTMRGG